MRFAKYFTGFIAIVAFFSFILPVRAQEDAVFSDIVPEIRIPGEHIENYDTHIQVGKDSTLTVTEKIVYDFAKVPGKHGIFRDIPFHYITPEGNSFTVHISIKSVTDETGAPYAYKLGRSSNNELEIKIGEANTTVSGIKTYIIKYTADRAVSRNVPPNNHDEVYWNAIGTEWKVPIAHASAHLELPQSVSSGLKMACYFGIKGSIDTCTSTTTDQKAISFAVPRELYYGQGMTVVVGFPAGIVQPPSSSQELSWWLKDNWPIGIPVIVLIIMVIVWSKYGRDPQGRGTIIAEYEAPDNLAPIEVGTIIDQRVDRRDISSLIIDLAVRGFLKIREVSASKWAVDYELVKLRNDANVLHTFEQTFFVGLFNGKETIKLSELKNSFYTTAQEVKQDVYDHLVEHGYFRSSPERLRGILVIVGLAVGFGGMYLLNFVMGGIAGWLMLCPLLAGLIIAGFGIGMSVKTKKGVLAKEHIEGFKLFLSVTEKDRLKFHNAPAKKPELFEKCLPYAMVLKVEKEWAGQFKDIYIEPPKWYSGSWTTFNVIAFSTSLNSFSAVANSSLMVAPSSGGSGFSGGSSGGGFGGGGGGSW